MSRWPVATPEKDRSLHFNLGPVVDPTASPRVAPLEPIVFDGPLNVFNALYSIANCAVDAANIRRNYLALYPGAVPPYPPPEATQTPTDTD